MTSPLQNSDPIFVRMGDKAVEVQWTPYTASILQQRHGFAMKLKNFYGSSVFIDEGYYSILIQYQESIADFELVKDELGELYNQSNLNSTFEPAEWHIPVLYEENSADLLSISKHTLLTFETIFKLHQEATYTVEFIGFLSGFPYLSGLPEKLNIPRRVTPNPKIKDGSVAIAAGQCGIYPQDSPGGWYVLGKSPLKFFNVREKQPNLLQIGDKVNFVSIDQSEYDSIEKNTIDLNLFKNG